jgi:two-component system NtrC family sensor kinase
MASLFLVPLQTAGRIWGTLNLAGSKSGTLPAAHRAFLSTVARILATAIANHKLKEQADKLSEDLIALQEVNKIISQSLDLENIMQRIVIEGKRLVKTLQCHLFLWDDRNQCLVGSASTRSKDFNIREVAIPLSEDSLPIESLKKMRVITVEESTGATDQEPAELSSIISCAAIFAPLIAKEQAIGVLICSDDSPARQFSQEEISRAETLAHQAAIALENARLFQVVSRSQKEWESTFDGMQDSVSVHDLSGKVIRANVALARRLKTTPQKMIGKTCSELYAGNKRNAGVCVHLESLRTESLIVEEVELPSMEGTFQISVSPWYDKNNRLVGAIHVAKDVSHEKLLQQQLIQSEKLSAIGELISGIAHELNNPLTGVMGYSQLLQLRENIDDRAKENLLKINNLALRCQKIVQNLLSFARKQKPERTLSNVNDILERTIELRNYELSVNNIEIVRKLDDNLPQTIADAHQLQQVFLNVITNAEHAMLEAHGRGQLSIASRADFKKNRIIVEIFDDGPGISEEHLNRIFDPFFTTKEVGKGTGLGLSLAYGIIKEHDGNIFASSWPGGGAAFVIELPIIAKLQEEPATLPEMLPRGSQFENLVRDKKMLVVDDEKYILDFFIEVFQPMPMQVDTASDGRAAMAMLQNDDYDLVVSDFKMPEMSGRDLYLWIKDQRPHLAARMIFVTGDTVSTETRSFFENNSSRYLAKPFKIEEVKEVIQQTLEGGL